jgi:hypothetical protein
MGRVAKACVVGHVRCEDELTLQKAGVKPTRRDAHSGKGQRKRQQVVFIIPRK